MLEPCRRCCRKSIKVKLAAVAETVNLAIVLEKLVFSREVNVMIVAYPMPLRLLKVLAQSSARDEMPVTLQAPIMTL